MAEENNNANERDIKPKLEKETPEEFIMNTGSSSSTKEAVKTLFTPKLPRRFSKRIIFVLGAAVTMVFLVIGMSARTPAPRDNAAAEKAQQNEYKMSSAESALDIDNWIQKASQPQVQQPRRGRTQRREQQQSSDEGIIVPSENGERGERRDDIDKAAADAEREREQQRIALSKQWLDLQQRTFLSTPAASGGNWTQTAQAQAQNSENRQNSAQSAADARRAEHDRLREAYLNSYINGGTTGTTAGRTQTEKEQFFNARNSGKGVLSTMVQAPISPYLIPSGTMIPCNLVVGINSDLPGYVVAQVSENVCDWKNPDVILIPQGTRVFGQYDSKIAFAQRRVQVSWSRLIYPDGTTLDLQGMPGADKKGYSGLSDKYYPRYGRMLTAAIMTAAFSSVGLLFDDSSSDYSVVTVDGSTVVIPNDNSARDEFAREVAETIGDAGEKLFDRYLNTSPTILIRPAKRFSIVVNADIPFFSSYGRVR